VLLSSNGKRGGKSLIRDWWLVIRRIRGVCEWHDIVSFENRRSVPVGCPRQGWSTEERDRHAELEVRFGIEDRILL
jgi:hypothetical protein